MKARYFKLRNWIILTLLGALGLNGCNNSKKAADRPARPRVRKEIMLLYGIPTTDYQQPAASGEKDTIPLPEVEPAEPDTLSAAPEHRNEIRCLYGVPTTKFRE